jgi:hypothetical protein
MERRERPNIDTVREVFREEDDNVRPEPSPAHEDEPSDGEGEEQGDS